MKIFTSFLPLIQLSDEGSFIFWCVKDPLLQNDIVKLNTNFAESLGFKTGMNYKIYAGPFKYCNLSKVMVSLPNFKEDWLVLNENYEIIQGIILDQIRLIKRGECFPVYLSIRKQPLWIKIEEFGGYKSTDMLGIISNETELVILDNFNDEAKDKSKTFNFPDLMVVPHSEFNFVCSSYHRLPAICSLKNHSFKITEDENIVNDIILIPDVILSKVFDIVPKTKIKLNLGPKDPITFSNICYYSIDGLKCVFNQSEHLNESVIATSNGIAVKILKLDSNKIINIQKFEKMPLNQLAEFLHKSSHKLISFQGSPGSGKTNHVNEAIRQLNYSVDFIYKCVYIDLLNFDISIFLKFDDYTIYFIDHVDEYFQSETDSDEKNVRKFVKICRKISDLLLKKTCRVLLISRSIKSLSHLNSILSLPFDCIFTIEKNESWNIPMTLEPLQFFFGFDEAKRILTRNILNPLMFSNIYKANQMNLFSSILISGPSGSGKTFLVQKFIKHYNIPSISIRGPEILDKYVGSSERGVRDLFMRARDIKPCIIFFDEFDSLVPKRGSNQSGVTDRIVNQFLTELDGTEDRSGVFIIATTSRPDLIDDAILRPGRIDQRIELSLPTVEEIKQFIIGKGIKLKKIKPLDIFLQSNTDIKISWADIFYVNWDNKFNAIAELIASVSASKHATNQNSNMPKATQKLCLS